MLEDVVLNSDRWLDLKDLINEEWRDIPTYEGLYEISNYGRVKSIGRINKSNHILYDTHILKCHINTKKYLDVELSVDGDSRRYRIHRLVAKSFIPNPENKEQVNHIDGNKQNNKITNLEWCDNSENQQHAFKNGLNYKKRYGESPNAKSIIQCDLCGKNIRCWDSMTRIYDECGYSISSISQCCRGKYKQAYGYIWKYYKENDNNEAMEL